MVVREITLSETDQRYEVYLRRNISSGEWNARWFDGSGVLVTRRYFGYDLNGLKVLLSEEAAK